MERTDKKIGDLFDGVLIVVDCLSLVSWRGRCLSIFLFVCVIIVDCCLFLFYIDCLSLVSWRGWMRRPVALGRLMGISCSTGQLGGTT